MCYLLIAAGAPKHMYQPVFILGLSGGKIPPKFQNELCQNWIPKHFRRDFLSSFWRLCPQTPTGSAPGPDLTLLFKLHNIWLVDSQENH